MAIRVTAAMSIPPISPAEMTSVSSESLSGPMIVKMVPPTAQTSATAMAGK